MAKVALKSVGRDLDAEDVVWDGLKTAGALARLLSEVRSPDPQDLRQVMGHIANLLQQAETNFHIVDDVLGRALPAAVDLSTVAPKPQSPAKKRKAKASKAIAGVAST
jgi:hypothetical protein